MHKKVLKKTCTSKSADDSLHSPGLKKRTSEHTTPWDTPPLASSILAKRTKVSSFITTFHPSLFVSPK